jgi:hypothetical protein
MTLVGGSTADQTITATDADGDAITFTYSGPAFMTVTSNPQAGNTRTGNIHLAPGFSSSGTHGATVTAADSGSPSLSNSKSFTITVCNLGPPPLLAQPANMSVNEGSTANQVLTATDPDGNPLSFSKAAGPTFMTVTTTSPGTGTATGNAHLAPGLSDAGVFQATVAVSDGSLCGTTSKSFTITVNDCPTCTPDQPPVVTAPATVNGAEGTVLTVDVTASDPDGDAIVSLIASGLPSGASFAAGAGNTSGTLNWTPSFTQAGSYSVTFTASNALSGSATTAISITNVNLASAFTIGGYKTIRLGSSKRLWCAQVEPVGGSFTITDVDPATLILISPGTGSVSQIPAFQGRTTVVADMDNDDIPDMKVCFRKEDLRLLFSNVTGTTTLTVTVEGQVITGGTFRAALDVDVVGTDGGISAATVSPNPFNPAGTLTFTTARPGRAKVELFDVAGRLVRTILDEPSLAAGVHDVRIEGRGQRGESLASGIYYIRGVSAEGEFTTTIAILK